MCLFVAGWGVFVCLCQRGRELGFPVSTAAEIIMRVYSALSLQYGGLPWLGLSRVHKDLLD